MDVKESVSLHPVLSLFSSSRILIEFTRLSRKSLLLVDNGSLSMNELSFSLVLNTLSYAVDRVWVCDSTAHVLLRNTGNQCAHVESFLFSD